MSSTRLGSSSFPTAALLVALSGCQSAVPVDPTGDTTPPPPAASCIEAPLTGNGWRWVRGAPLRAIDGRSADAIFAVGEQGRVLHWDDGAWQPIESPTSESLVAVYASAADDVWIASLVEGLYHWDGNAWSRTSSRTATRFVGDSADDIWAIGPQGVTHFDGTEWRDVPGVELPTLSDLAARAPDDVWATGIADGRDVVRHFDGATWSTVGAPFDNTCGYARLVRHEGEVLVVRFEREIWRFDGSNWVLDAERFPTPAEGEAIAFGREGLITLPSELHCYDPVQVDELTFCRGAYGGGIVVGDGSGEWRETTVRGAGDSLAEACWDSVPPSVWAGDAELAWGTSPDHVIRVRALPMAGDVAQHAIESRVDGEFVSVSFVTETGSQQALVAGGDVDLSGTAAIFFFTANGALYRTGSSVATRIALPAELEGIALTRVAAIDDDSAFVLGERESPARSYVLRVDGDDVRVLLDLDAADDRTGIAFDDIEIDAAGTAWVLASEAWQGRSDRTVLFHQVGESFARRDLWETWWGEAATLEIHGDDIWVQSESLVLLSPSIMSSTEDASSVASVNGLDPTESSPPMSWGQLAVDERGVWVTTSRQAAFLPR